MDFNGLFFVILFSRKSARQNINLFYFEKLNKRTTKKIFNNFKNNSALPKISGPIKPSKSLERSPPARQRFRPEKSDRITIKTAPNKQKLPNFIVGKSKSNEGKMYTPDDTYIKLEEKINVLQNQLENFEIRYQQLENFAKKKVSPRKLKKVKKTLEENVIFIPSRFLVRFRYFFSFFFLSCFFHIR